MLDKILGRTKTAINIGNKAQNEAKSTSAEGTELAAYITFPELNGGISEKLETKLTIGSEIGELVIEGESLSPRHCTLIKNNEVISIIDHSSVEGTFLNKKRLEPGRTFFIDQSDKLKIGSLKAIIEFLEVPISDEYIEESDGLVIDDIDGLALEGIEPVEEQDSEITVSRFLNGEVEAETPPDKELELATDLPEVNEVISEEMKIVTEEVEIPEVPDKDVSYYFDDDNASNDINSMDLEEVELDESFLEDFKKSKSANKLKLAKSRKSKGKAKNKKLAAKSEKAKKSKKKNSKIDFPATHIVFRFLGLLFDVLFCITLINIFYVFVDFQNLYDGIPADIQLSIKGIYESTLAGYYDSLVMSVPELGGVVQDISNYEKFDSIFSFLCMLFGFRLLATLAFSVSLGNAIIGIRVHGNGLLKRGLGVLREFIGVFTFPFILFDLPTFMNKRSFKEVISKTHLYTPSKITTMFLSVFFIPVFIFSVCFSPIIKGLEFLPSIPVEEIVKKLKPWQYENKVYSSLIDLSFDLHGNLTTLPSFQIEVKDKKRFLTFGVVFIDKENGMNIDIKKVKEFSMLSVYKDFVDLNILSEYFQPSIFSLVKDVSHKNENFKRNSTNMINVSHETQDIIKSIFSLEVDNIYDFILNNGPMIAGFRDFREKIESLIGEKIRKIKFASFARKNGFLTEHKTGKKVFYYFIPIGELEGKVYYLSKDLSSAKMSVLTGQLVFGNKANVKSIDPIAEFVKGFKADPAFEDFELSQHVYIRYFEVGKHFQQNNNEMGIEFIKLNLNKIISVLGENKENNQKLYLNLSELREALKNKDDNFFNIKRSLTVTL